MDRHIAIGLVLCAFACARQDDGRDVVMVEPTEETSGDETGLAERPSSRTIGGSTSPDELTPYEQDATAATDELMTQAQYLDRLLAADSCANVEQLRDRICDLAGRICEIADVHPESRRTRMQCEDATARCTDAAQRVGEQCDF